MQWLSQLSNTWPEPWHQFQAQLAWAAHTPVCLRCHNRLPNTTLPLTHCLRCLDWCGFEVVGPDGSTAPLVRGADKKPSLQTVAVWQWTTARYHQLLGYKTRPNPRLTPLLADLLIQGWLTANPPQDQASVVLIPMPRHQAGLTNHLMPLARTVCARMGWTLWPRGLERVRPLASAQKHLSARQRHSNMAGSLVLSPPRLRGEGFLVTQVIILDDLRTTGASLHEAHRAVKAHYPTAAVTSLTLLQVPASAL